MEKIDFVILWVDGNDKEWREEKNKYQNKKDDCTTSNSRYRDWDNLQYWFRGVEKFAPWVNKIHFVTWGHIPNWLNINNPKLNIVKHEEFIPKEYLPTFNSNTIELNIHRIKDLSEKFVLFNDDMFLIRDVEPKDFFYKNLPVDECIQNIIIPFGKKGQLCHALINNIDIINRNFNKRKVMNKNISKYINFKYGMGNFRTIMLLPWYAFTGFHNTHVPIAYKKETFEKVWGKESDVLIESCNNKFREYNDVTHWVMRYWQLCEANFSTRNCKFGKYFDVSNETQKIEEWIKKQKSKTICINDVDTNFEFEYAKNKINESFNAILSKKSSFEK